MLRHVLAKLSSLRPSEPPADPKPSPLAPAPPCYKQGSSRLGARLAHADSDYADPRSLFPAITPSRKAAAVLGIRACTGSVLSLGGREEGKCGESSQGRQEGKCCQGGESSQGDESCQQEDTDGQTSVNKSRNESQVSSDGKGSHTPASNCADSKSKSKRDNTPGKDTTSKCKDNTPSGNFKDTPSRSKDENTSKDTLTSKFKPDNTPSNCKDMLNSRSKDNSSKDTLTSKSKPDTKEHQRPNPLKQLNESKLHELRLKLSQTRIGGPEAASGSPEPPPGDEDSISLDSGDSFYERSFEAMEQLTGELFRDSAVFSDQEDGFSDEMESPIPPPRGFDSPVEDKLPEDKIPEGKEDGGIDFYGENCNSMSSSMSGSTIFASTSKDGSNFMSSSLNGDGAFCSTSTLNNSTPSSSLGFEGTFTSKCDQSRPDSSLDCKGSSTSNNLDCERGYKFKGELETPSEKRLASKLDLLKPPRGKLCIVKPLMSLASPSLSRSRKLIQISKVSLNSVPNLDVRFEKYIKGDGERCCECRQGGSLYIRGDNHRGKREASQSNIREKGGERGAYESYSGERGTNQSNDECNICSPRLTTRRHSEKFGTYQSYSGDTDTYQSNEACNLCPPNLTTRRHSEKFIGKCQCPLKVGSPRRASCKSADFSHRCKPDDAMTQSCEFKSDMTLCCGDVMSKSCDFGPESLSFRCESSDVSSHSFMSKSCGPEMTKSCDLKADLSLSFDAKPKDIFNTCKRCERSFDAKSTNDMSKSCDLKSDLSLKFDAKPNEMTKSCEEYSSGSTKANGTKSCERSCKDCVQCSNGAVCSACCSECSGEESSSGSTVVEVGPSRQGWVRHVVNRLQSF